MSGDSQQCPHNARFRISKVEVSDLIGYAVFSVDNFEALAPQLLTPKKFFKKKDNSQPSIHHQPYWVPSQWLLLRPSLPYIKLLIDDPAETGTRIETETLEHEIEFSQAVTSLSVSLGEC